MRNIVWMLSAVLILPCVGCAGNSGLAGKWVGAITEKGKPTKVALDLQTQGDKIAGTLSLLDNTGDKTATPASFMLVNARRSDDKFEFVVPVSGQLDADTLYFELLIKGNQLEGYGRKMRQGSPDLPTVFVKQK